MKLDGAGGLRILIADDDPNDRKLLQLASCADVPASLFVVEDGEEVIDYLRGRGRFGDRKAHPFPDVVVVDLKMPRMNGLEVVKWIRESSNWPKLPVLLLSGSGLDRDVEEAYEHGANGYFQKPHSVAKLRRVLSVIADYWQLMERPKRTRRGAIY